MSSEGGEVAHTTDNRPGKAPDAPHRLPVILANPSRTTCLAQGRHASVLEPDVARCHISPVV